MSFACSFNTWNKASGTFITTKSWLYHSFLSANAQQNEGRIGKPFKSHFMNFRINTFLRVEPFSELQEKKMEKEL